MIKIEKTEVLGWEHAIRGMRNPMNSWEKSNTIYGTYWTVVDGHECVDIFGFTIGDNDLELMKRLSSAGTDHAKFMRMITVYCDIVAPLYWWKEFDTYKVGTVANSCSTMHKIHEKEFTLDDFSHDKLFDWNDYDDDLEEEFLPNYNYEYINTPIGWLEETVDALNNLRKGYIETKDKKFWWAMIQLLPSSYNQRRTVMLNYQVLKNMYHARKNHKLDEWRKFCDWIETLPYAKELICEV